MITKSKVQFQINGIQSRIASDTLQKEKLEVNIPLLEARLAELQVELEAAPEDPVFQSL